MVYWYFDGLRCFFCPEADSKANECLVVIFCRHSASLWRYDRFYEALLVFGRISTDAKDGLYC